MYIDDRKRFHCQLVDCPQLWVLLDKVDGVFLINRLAANAITGNVLPATANVKWLQVHIRLASNFLNKLVNYTLHHTLLVK